MHRKVEAQRFVGQDFSEFGIGGVGVPEPQARPFGLQALQNLLELVGERNLDFELAVCSVPGSVPGYLVDQRGSEKETQVDTVVRVSRLLVETDKFLPF